MKHKQYYSGGLAELVPTPTPLTYSFFSYWFTGEKSVGKAMDLIGLPHQKTMTPLLVYDDGDMFIDLHAEEQTLYESTVFQYAPQKNFDSLPKLSLSFSKLFSPSAMMHTLQILLRQSQWIADPHKYTKQAEQIVKNLPDTIHGDTIEAVEAILIEKVWPAIIAIGMLSEFFHQLLEKEAGGLSTEVLQQVSSEIAEDDWFFTSLTDQQRVKDNHLSFNTYMKQYGIRADNDYELTVPRWHEMPQEIQKRIDRSSYEIKKKEPQLFDKKIMQLIKTVVTFQLLRSEGKRKALLHMDHMRQLILQKTGEKIDLTSLTRDEILNNDFSHIKKQLTSDKSVVKKPSHATYALSGKGRSVSAGVASGIVENITTNDAIVSPNTVGIFPNASPQFAIQFPKCVGMIFLQGGLTSHGAIVAREFGIPALIDHNAKLPDGIKVQINGKTGEWEVQK